MKKRLHIKAVYFIVITTLLIGFTHCRPSQTKRLNNQYKDIYIDQFKLTYFRQVLKKSYNNSGAIQEIIKLDHSGFVEPILNESDYSLIDSLTTADNNKLVADSLEGNRRAEGSQGKRPLGYILHRLNSRWLDSLTKQRLKLSGVPEYWSK